MRIAFVGKGGSGKTTMSSLFCRHLVSLGAPVLAFDADINQHLGVALGLTEREASTIPALASDLTLIKEHLRGSNPRIGSAEEMIKTTPPGRGSRRLRIDERNPIFSTFGRPAAGATLLASGSFEADDIGVKCYHSKTGAVELILNHLVDGAGEYAVVDMTAGADSFASGLFTKFDLTVLVVEPTRKSLSVYEQYRTYAQDYGVRLAVVGNKIENDDDLAFLRGAVGDSLLAVFRHSPFVRASERDTPLPIDALEGANRLALETVRHALDACERDWDKFRRQTFDFHVRNALSWGNAAIGRDLRGQIDPEFAFGTASQ